MLDTHVFALSLFWLMLMFLHVFFAFLFLRIYCLTLRRVYFLRKSYTAEGFFQASLQRLAFFENLGFVNRTPTKKMYKNLQIHFLRKSYTPEGKYHY